MAKKKPRKPQPTPSPDTLRKMSVHVAYEWDMLLDLLPKLRELEVDGPQETLRRAAVESFLIHARQLLAFLYGEGNPLGRNGVFAVHYAPSWRATRGNIHPPALEPL